AGDTTGPECARPRAQHCTKVRSLATNGMLSVVWQLLRPRTGALRSVCGSAALCFLVEPRWKLRLMSQKLHFADVAGVMFGDDEVAVVINGDLPDLTYFGRGRIIEPCAVAGM